MFYKSPCHVLIRHDDLRNPCKTFLLLKNNLPSEDHSAVAASEFYLTRSSWLLTAGPPIFDERSRGDNSKPRLERVVVAGEDGEGRAANAESILNSLAHALRYGGTSPRL